MGFKIIEKKSERRTYITGQFRGKYWSEYDAARSDGLHEDFYDINLYEADVSISAYRRSSEGHFTNAPTVSEYVSHSFPKTVRCSLIVDGVMQHFDAQLCEPIVADLAVIDVRQEDEQSLGTLTGIVYGYLLDYVSEWVEVEEPEPTIEELEPEVAGKDDGSTKIAGVNRLDRVRDVLRVFERPLLSGRTINKPNKPTDSLSLLSAIGGVIGMLFSLLIGVFWILISINLLFSVGPTLLAFAGLWAIIYGINWILKFRFIRLISKWLLYLVLGFVIFGFLQAISNALNTTYLSSADRITDVREDKPSSYKQVEQPSDKVRKDSLIRHYRVWNDYSGKIYQGWLILSRPSFVKAQRFKDRLPLVVNSNSTYDRLFDTLSVADTLGLRYTYATFDSLRQTNHLNTTAFANLLVSCIQDIPYTILLPADCNPQLYPDIFTQRYLAEGGLCEGYIKYGLNSPLEFLGTLKGDCDTRTLLLYTVLKHYQYDVIVLTNSDFGHSLLALNLPGVGSYRL